MHRRQIRLPMLLEKKGFWQGLHRRSCAPRFAMPILQISMKMAWVVLPSAAAIVSIEGFGTLKYNEARRSRSASVHVSPPFTGSGDIDITRAPRLP
jgi:hypothetical protein